MAAHFEHHCATTLSSAVELETNVLTSQSVPDKSTTGSMTLQNFNILQVLEQGTILVASEGQVYNAATAGHAMALFCRSGRLSLHLLCSLFCFTLYIILRGLHASSPLQEYELALDLTSRAEQLAKQRKNLKKR